MDCLVLYCVALHYIALYCIKTETKHISFIPVCPHMVKFCCFMVKVWLHCKIERVASIISFCLHLWWSRVETVGILHIAVPLLACYPSNKPDWLVACCAENPSYSMSRITSDQLLTNFNKSSRSVLSHFGLTSISLVLRTVDSKVHVWSS